MSSDARTILEALTARQRDILGHALGMNYRPRVDRNYYCASLRDGAPPAEIAGLVSHALLVPGRAINDGQDRYYYVTDVGIAVATLAFPPPKPLTRSQARYQRYLQIHDAYPDLTFREFLQPDRGQLSFSPLLNPAAAATERVCA